MALTPQEQQEQQAIIQQILAARTPADIQACLNRVDGWMEAHPEDTEVPGFCEQLVYALDRWKAKQER